MQNSSGNNYLLKSYLLNISHQSIQPSSEKVSDLNKFNTPLSYAQIHSFIGLASYCRKFIKNFASIVSPLLRAAQHKNIVWTPGCKIAFETIKQLLQQEPVLKLPDFRKDFEIHTACNYGVGATLTQQHNGHEHPVAYFSKHLSKTKRNYSTSERELLAIVLASHHFKQFLYGGKFIVWTDHQPLKYLLSTKEPAARLLRLLKRMNSFEYEIKYKKGSANGDADALSRLPTEPDEDEDKEEDAPIVINNIIINAQPLCEEQRSDNNLIWLFDLKLQAATENQHIIKLNAFENQEQQSYYKQWESIIIMNNKLYRTWSFMKGDRSTIIFQSIVPRDKRIEIMNAAHESVASGHLGSEKTINRIVERFYWPVWEQQVNAFVISCVNISHESFTNCIFLGHNGVIFLC
jgi:hypothetical protein